MRGTILIFDPAKVEPTEQTINGPPLLELLKAAVGGGYIELVPHWTSFKHKGHRRRCVAFCDEHGKLNDLPINVAATLLWGDAMKFTVGRGCSPEYLVGQIAVVMGDDEFMEAL